jgi:hypothetical protein
MGVPIVLFTTENNPHTSSHHVASFPNGILGYIISVLFECASVVSLTLHFIHNQFSHLQISLHSFTSYINPPISPPPSTSSLHNLLPHRPSHLALGHPFLYLYAHPKLFFIYLVIVKILYFQHFLSFLSSPLTTFFFWKFNPCHPWLGHPLSFTHYDIVHKP